MKIEPRDPVCSSDQNVRPREDTVRRWLRTRELGAKATLGHNNNVSRQLYSSVAKVRSWNPMDTTNHTHHGGIFNFDFSKDGSVLVAACEKRSILVFDPLNGNLIASKDKAHNDCVNCVRFLDSRVFATCSDDTTVCLWDVRYMKHKIRSLQAHSNWVKNIEYDSSSGLLVTSGFDGSVFTWDINRYSETEENYKRVFHTPGLMRMKLTPDATKLVVATGNGYLMVIHDLDLSSLAQDLEDFLPNMYRLMQQTNSPIPQAYQHNHVFSQRRNRVELISDFPADNKADMIASLEVHPQGWCVVSRNTSTYEASEWTCVHDIQEPVGIVEEYDPSRGAARCTGGAGPSCSSSSSFSRRRSPEDDEDEPAGSLQQPLPESAPASTEPSRTGSPAFVLSISINESTASPPNISQSEGPAGGGGAARDADRSSSPGPPGSPLTVRPEQVSDPFSSSSVRFDLTQPLQGQASSSSEDDQADQEEEEEEERESDYEDEVYPRREMTSREENRHVRTESSNSSSGSASADPLRRSDHSSPLNVPNSPPSPSSPTPPSVSPATGRTTRTSAIDVLPSLHVQSPSGATFQSRWDNDNDSAFMPPPTSAASPSPTPPPASSAPISAGIRLGESLTVLIRSSRRGGLVLLGHNKLPCSSQPYIHTNRPRLTHYVEELNVGRGFIKEVSFSSDGRLICSPYGFGVRLLAFDPQCSEMCDVIPNSPVKLHPLTSNMSHTSAVVTTKFSPLHCMFVSGCLNGKIDFHQPVL